jgi:hypothetical protein
MLGELSEVTVGEPVLGKHRGDREKGQRLQFGHRPVYGASRRRGTALRLVAAQLWTCLAVTGCCQN